MLAAGIGGFFFFNDTATTEISTLSLHDALPIAHAPLPVPARPAGGHARVRREAVRDRKSTRLNSSHGYISYAVSCLKKKKIRVRYWCLSKHSPALCRNYLAGIVS